MARGPIQPAEQESLNPDTSPLGPDEVLEDDLEGDLENVELIDPDDDENVEILEPDEDGRRGELPLGGLGDTRGKKKRQAKKGTTEKQKTSREMTFEEWCARMDRDFGWDGPGVECRLIRLYPRTVGNIPTAGLVDRISGAHFTIPDVQERHGGGAYEMELHAPALGPNKPPQVRRKRFDISGSPKTLAADPKDGMPPALADQQGQSMHPAVEKGLVGLVDRMQERAWKERNAAGGGFDPKAISHPYESAMRTMQESMEGRAVAREGAAREAVQAAQTRESEARMLAEQARQELERVQRETQLRVEKVTAEGSNMLATLLPTFNEGAARQVQHMAQTFEAREARIETGHIKEVDQLARLHEAQLMQLHTTHQAELARIEASFAAQIGILQQQLEFYRLQTATMQVENTKLRDDLMQQRLAQLEALKVERDPMTKISELQQFRDMAKDFIGGGEEAEETGWMKIINNGLSTLGPLVEQVVGARAQQQQAAPQQALVTQQQMAPQVPRQPPSPREPEGVKLKKEDVAEAMQALTNIYISKTPPEMAAAAAAQHLDHKLLRALARKDADQLMDKLQSESLVEGPLLSQEGRDYMKIVLETLRNI
ncbi:hypothetical protein KJ966_31640 [bacterium]|nr:hypothetical protein [bacterium]